MKPDFSSVTELAGDEVSREQVERLCHRYYWAAEYCRGKDVLEAACGSGQGLGYLAKVARSLRGGDFAPEMVERARRHYEDRVRVSQFDAQSMPFGDGSLDVVLLFEAIYYLPSPGAFLQECRRVLRPGGQVLLATANKDLYDFNASPYSHTYFGVTELDELLGRHGFRTEFLAAFPVSEASIRQRLLRPVKRLAVGLGLMPKTMAGKKLLKRLVFGGLVKMPDEINGDTAPYVAPEKIDPGIPDTTHKVVYCRASLES